MARKVLAVIPTYNRRELIELTSRYLRRIPFDPERFAFLVSDDCSTEFGLSFLREAYAALPNVTFMKTSRNAGAIGHTWTLLKLFAQSDRDKVLVLDSDLVVDENCLRWIDAFDAEPISSLYNSRRHRVEGAADGYCTKADIGWAGALLGRSTVVALLDLFGPRPFDDWALSDLARQNGLKIKVATPSAVEHIGIAGSNNFAPEAFDRSIDFPPDRIDQPTREFLLQRHGIDPLLQWQPPTP
jgi:glycosyltransferase involved in cell wall biosynthesis